MRSYQVKITEKALADMTAIYDYIALTLKAPGTALEQYNRIADEIESLSQLPERCMLLASRPERDLGMRRLLVDNYCAVYGVDDGTVTVLRVLYSASDVLSRLRDD